MYIFVLACDFQERYKNEQVEIWTKKAIAIIALALGISCLNLGFS